jgi:Zn-dependent protease
MNGGDGGFLGGSIHIGEVWGIRIKIHVLFLVLVGYWLLTAGNPATEAIWLLALFGSVFLHELGHCAGARLVGGSANEVILWPLGGLAMIKHPPKASAEFISTAAGPAVNLVLFALGVGIMLATHQGQGLDANPQTATGLTLLVEGLWQTNLLLFLFNVLPAYPMDGGRILRSVLWAIPGVGWRTATLIATVTAMVFGGLFVGVGAVTGGMFLALIGVMVLMASWSEFKRAKAHRSLPRIDDDRMPHER